MTTARRAALLLGAALAPTASSGATVRCTSSTRPAAARLPNRRGPPSQWTTRAPRACRVATTVWGSTCSSPTASTSARAASAGSVSMKNAWYSGMAMCQVRIEPDTTTMPTLRPTM